MRWITETEIAASPWKIEHGQHVLTLGSCFADNLGSRMAARLLNVRVNPFGALYNPASVATALEAVLDGRVYADSEMIESEGSWRSLDFSAVLSGSTALDAAAAINATVESLGAELPGLDVLIVTFGSTHVFEYIPTGCIVGNCHKLPSSLFSEREMSLDEIIKRWAPLLQRLKIAAPRLHVLFTVSPVRHKAYGLHADRLGKSRLLLAVDELCRLSGATYFPAYEILTDELRDYRFYAADMVHPSDQACNYIFERWTDAFCSPATKSAFADCLKFTSMLTHRIIATSPDAQAAHIKAITAMRSRLLMCYPMLASAVSTAVAQSPYADALL